MSSDISAHYATPGLMERILSALRESGVDGAALSCDDLAPLDQFHVRGKAATLELADSAGVLPRHHVLDIGGGIGGPARLLADSRGCRVSVVDVTEEYCRVGRVLTQLVGLSQVIQFYNCSALELPFANSTFDVAWQQHSSMNIADKRSLYCEIARVLKPQATLALYEVLAGAGEVRFPVPWAREPSISHLATIEELRADIAAAGFITRSWIDQTTLGADWFRARLVDSQADSTRQKLGLHLLIGQDAPLMLRNMLDNLERESVRIIQATFELHDTT